MIINDVLIKRLPRKVKKKMYKYFLKYYHESRKNFKAHVLKVEELYISAVHSKSITLRDLQTFRKEEKEYQRKMLRCQTRFWTK